MVKARSSKSPTKSPPKSWESPYASPSLTAAKSPPVADVADLNKLYDKLLSPAEMQMANSNQGLNAGEVALLKAEARNAQASAEMHKNKAKELSGELAEAQMRIEQLLEGLVDAEQNASSTEELLVALESKLQVLENTADNSQAQQLTEEVANTKDKLSQSHARCEQLKAKLGQRENEHASEVKRLNEELKELRIEIRTQMRTQNSANSQSPKSSAPASQNSQSPKSSKPASQPQQSTLDSLNNNTMSPLAKKFSKGNQSSSNSPKSSSPKSSSPKSRKETTWFPKSKESSLSPLAKKFSKEEPKIAASKQIPDSNATRLGKVGKMGTAELCEWLEGLNFTKQSIEGFTQERVTGKMVLEWKDNGQLADFDKWTMLHPTLCLTRLHMNRLYNRLGKY